MSFKPSLIRSLVAATFFACASLTTAAPADAAPPGAHTGPTMIYWEVDGVKGESTAAVARDMIEVVGYEHGVTMPMTSGPSNTSRASGRSVHGNFSITKLLDQSSPLLSLKASSGDEIKSTRVHVFRTDAAGKPTEVMRYTFEGVLLTSVSVKGFGDQQLETVTFAYKKITWEYTGSASGGPGGRPGKIASTWSVEENKGK